MNFNDLCVFHYKHMIINVRVLVLLTILGDLLPKKLFERFVRARACILYKMCIHDRIGNKKMSLI